MNTFSKVLAIATVAFVGSASAIGGSFKVDPALARKLAGKNNVFIAAAINQQIESQYKQAAVSTSLRFVKKYAVKDGGALKEMGLSGIIADNAGYYVTNVASRKIEAAAGKHITLDDIANKCDILPEEVYGVKVRSRVNPVIRGAAEVVAPYAEEFGHDAIAEAGSTGAQYAMVRGLAFFGFTSQPSSEKGA